VCILAIPISSVLKLHMGRTQKIAICFTFLLGSLYVDYLPWRRFIMSGSLLTRSAYVLPRSIASSPSPVSSKQQTSVGRRAMSSYGVQSSPPSASSAAVCPSSDRSYRKYLIRGTSSFRQATNHPPEAKARANTLSTTSRPSRRCARARSPREMSWTPCSSHS
jgi:hypothetical protein